MVDFSIVLCTIKPLEASGEYGVWMSAMSKCIGFSFVTLLVAMGWCNYSLVFFLFLMYFSNEC